MTQLEEIIAKYPNCYYCEDMDTICIDVNEEPQTVETDGKWLIEDHFDGETMLLGDFTDPDSEEITLTGEEYVKGVGGVAAAFRELGIDTW
jgi:hypothetical protein